MSPSDFRRALQHPDDECPISLDLARVRRGRGGRRSTPLPVGGVAVIGGGPLADCGIFGVDSGTVNLTDFSISNGNANNEIAAAACTNYAATARSPTEVDWITSQL